MKPLSVLSVHSSNGKSIDFKRVGNTAILVEGFKGLWQGKR